MRYLALEKCSVGMVLGKDIYARNGTVLFKCGVVLDQNHIDSLEVLGYPGIYLDDDFSKEIQINDIVSSETRIAASMAVKELYDNIKRMKVSGTSQVISNIKTIVENIVSQVYGATTPVASVISSKIASSYTYQHSADVAVLSIILGKELNFTQEQSAQLGRAAIFHDIGKAQVQGNIIEKPDKLTLEEIREVQKHPELSYLLVKNFLCQPDDICEGCLLHHERFSGHGYPKGLSGEQIPIFSRIIAVADAYDAIISNRSYRKAIAASEAYEYIALNAAGQFDPTVVEVFVRKIAPYPVGSSVRLNNGRIGVVAENYADHITLPRVKLEKNSQQDSEYINLSTDPSGTFIIEAV